MATVAERLQNPWERVIKPPPADQRVLLNWVNWKTYETFLEAFVGHHRFRLTYDRGCLEIMAPLWNHEWWKVRFRYLILALGIELKMAVQSGGSTTFRREDVQRGLEPDDCYYIRNAARMAGPREIDLTRDPPPDLAVEIDITSSCLDRLGIYAALQVPEVWRFDGESFEVYGLGPNGEFELRRQSISFPTLPLGDVIPFLEQTQQDTDIAILDACREWVRQHALPG